VPVLNTAAKVLLKPVPRFISATGHAVIDYVTVGSFFISAAGFWPRNKRAALAAAICGGSGLALSLLTDYPGSRRKAIRFRVHGEIELGLAAMTAMMPELLGFKETDERKFFILQGALITAARELTDFREKRTHAKRRVERFRAA
jgi:hypothetical protein